MLTRPRYILIISLIYLCEPVLKVLDQSFMIGLGPLAILEYQFHSNNIFKFLALFFLFPIAGICLYISNRWSYFLFLLLNLLSLTLNFTQESHESPEKFWASQVVILLLTGFFLKKDIREIFLNPEIRNWEAKSRFKVELPLKIHSDSFPSSLDSSLHDISESGALISHISKAEKGQKVTMEFEEGEDLFKINALIVSSVQKGENHFHGVHFVDLTDIKRAQLKMYTTFLKKLGRQKQRA